MTKYYLEPEDYEIAEENGIPKDIAKRRFYNYGWTAEEAVSKPLKRRSNIYVKYQSLCEKSGVNRHTFYDRLRRGISELDAATIPVNGLRSPGGRKNPKLTKEQYEIAEKNGISRHTVAQRVYNYKWDVQKAITKPANKAHRRKDL